MKRKLQVLFAASEAVPFMKTGGLGDVAGSLPKDLKEKDVEVRVIIPKYKKIKDEYKAQMEHVCDFYMMLGWRNVYVGIEKLDYQGVTYYFVDNEYYFNRDNAYGYFDDGERIAFLSKAIVECLQYIPDYMPDILHCNDWHTALSPVFLREFYQDVEGYQNIKTIFTVHNLKFQGQMSDMVLGDILALDMNPAAAAQLRSDERSINFMKGALCYSDLLSTVSETYAQEIQTDFFGENMQDIYRRRSDCLYGIMNGIDQEVYNPETSESIAANFSVDDLTGKAKCKEELQKELGLEVRPDIPMITMCGRLTQQKGLDLLECIMDELMQLPLQLVVLGTGDQVYEDMFRGYAAKYPGKLAACITFSEALSHRLYSAGDLFLMPSLFEPCGLSQMISMRFGNLPIVRETGGLKDSVTPYNKFTGEGNGFSFANYNAHEMLFTIKDALGVYFDDKEMLNKLIRQAMTTDFSWNVAAEKYKEMYARLCPEIVYAEEEPAPVAEEPKAEEPAPAVEEPKAEESAPVAEEPKAEEPAPAAEEPKVEEPAPVAEEPKAEKPAPAKKPAAKKTTAKKSTSTKKTPAKKAETEKKAPAKKSTAKKTTAEKKAPAKKTAAKKTTKKAAEKTSEEGQK